jgi:CheY-like chemotaxis protein
MTVMLPQSNKLKQVVLVVDDNVDQAQLLAVLLRGCGHEVHVEHDGHGAIRTALRLRPDYVFVDLSLPALDGWQVTRQLRADPRLRLMQIIAVSGHAGDEARQKSREAGIDVHLVKPVDPDFLESLLGRAGAAR